MSAFNSPVCDALAAVARECEAHALGLSNTIDITEAGNILTVPAPALGTHTISADITMVVAAVFYRWKIGDTDAEFTSTATGTKGNQTYRNTLTVFVPLTRDAVEVLVNKMLNGEFIVAFRDKGGTRRLLGHEYCPAMIPDGGIQEVVNNTRNGYTITFENMGKTPYMYSGIIPLT